MKHKQADQPKRGRGRPRLPSVSFVIPTFNAGAIFKESLASVKALDYPTDRIELVVVDGGSNDQTLTLATEAGATIINERTGRPEAATAMGYQAATGDLIVNFPSDNVIPTRSWLRQMVAPFMAHADVVAAQTLRYGYAKTDTLFNRYFALFGASDPVPFYLGKRDRISWFEDDWTLMGTKVTDTPGYYLVDFTKESVPTLGANGYMVRREIALTFIGDPLDWFHIDSTLDMIAAGYGRFAIVKNTIFHRTGETFGNFLKKRRRYMGIYQRDVGRRRYHIYEPRDLGQLMLFVLGSLTLVRPTWDALKGWAKIHDPAWFFHPLMCLAMTWIYGEMVIREKLGQG